jgi:hypothetical protein
MSLRSLRNQAAKIRAGLGPDKEAATVVCLDPETSVITSCITTAGRMVHGADAQRIAARSGVFKTLILPEADWNAV